MYGEVVEGIDGAPLRAGADRLKAARGARRTSNSTRTTCESWSRPSRRSTRRRPDRRSRRMHASSCAGRTARCSTPGTRRARRSTAALRHPRRPRHRGQRRPDGVREQRRELRHRRLLHARSRRRASGGLYGEFLVERAGRGRRRRDPHAGADRGACASGCPRRTTQLVETLDRLETHFRDMQDIEFTVEHGTLYLLQTRTGKRTAAAACGSRRDGRRGPDLARGGGRAHRSGPARPAPAPDDRPGAAGEVAARGLNASPGAASGAIVLDADTAEERGKAGEEVILVRWETTPDDIHGLIQARGCSPRTAA